MLTPPENGWRRDTNSSCIGLGIVREPSMRKETPDFGIVNHQSETRLRVLACTSPSMSQRSLVFSSLTYDSNCFTVSNMEAAMSANPTTRPLRSTELNNWPAVRAWPEWGHVQRLFAASHDTDVDRIQALKGLQELGRHMYGTWSG